MNHSVARSLTAGLTLTAMLCGPALAQTFQQPALPVPVMPGPATGMPGTPAAPAISLSQNDRRLLADLSEKIDLMIAEAGDARAQTMVAFADGGAQTAIAESFKRENARIVGPVTSIDDSTVLMHLRASDASQVARPARLSRSIDYGPGTERLNDEMVRNIAEVFYDRYIAKLNDAKEGLAARPATIAQQIGVTPPSMTGKVRDGLEADLKYLQGGHDLWKSAESELRETFLPKYQKRLLDVLGRHASYTQRLAELIDRRENAIYDLEVDFVAVHTERERQVAILESYPPGSGLGNDNIARIRELDAELEILNEKIGAAATNEADDAERFYNCSLSLGVWSNELAGRPRVSPPVSIYDAPQHAVAHLGGRAFFRAYETDALMPDLNEHLKKDDPCGAAEPPEEVPARLSIVIPRFEAPPPPDLLDDDDLAAPMPSLVFEPASEVHYGHPFHVEALFEEDRPGSTYSVRLNGQHSVVVEQMEENPRLYRSATLVLTYQGLIHGGGR